MSEPFLGQIHQVAFDWPPKHYAWCNGQTMPVNQNQALYSLLGDQFGSDNRTYFKLPDLQGRVPAHWGNASVPAQGFQGGMEMVSLTPQTLGPHTHGFMATAANGEKSVAHPTGTRILGNAVAGAENVPHSIYRPPGQMTSLNPDTMTAAGGGMAHNNLQPSTVIGFIIALTGIYPSRN